MDNNEILMQEYNNLWNEKLIHKQGIRKFHNYLTYITAIGSLALAFHGLNPQDLISTVTDPVKAELVAKNSSSILHLFFISFTPVLLLTLTFPLNDMFHIFSIGNHLGQIEKKINTMTDENLLLWEHKVCPVVYGGNKDQQGNKISNIIAMGDGFLLIPVLIIMGLFATIISCKYIYNHSLCLSVLYIALVSYMLGVVLVLAYKLWNYTQPEGKLTKIIQNTNSLPTNIKNEEQS